MKIIIGMLLIMAGSVVLGFHFESLSVTIGFFVISYGIVMKDKIL